MNLGHELKIKYAQLSNPVVFRNKPDRGKCCRKAGDDYRLSKTEKMAFIKDILHCIKNLTT